MLKSRRWAMVGGVLMSTVAACGAGAPEIIYECQVDADGDCSCQGSPNDVAQREQPLTSTCSAGSETGRMCCGAPGWPGANADGLVGMCSCSKRTKCDNPYLTKKVESCYEGTSSTAPPATASPSTCSDTGFCGPNTDKCSCGTKCLHTSVGGYLCGFGCSTDADCRGKKDPQSGESFSTCGKGTFDNFCR